jgi:hypothetical protein
MRSLAVLFLLTGSLAAQDSKYQLFSWDRGIEFARIEATGLRK